MNAPRSVTAVAAGRRVREAGQPVVLVRYASRVDWRLEFIVGRCSIGPRNAPIMFGLLHAPYFVKITGGGPDPGAPARIRRIIQCRQSRPKHSEPVHEFGLHGHAA